MPSSVKAKKAILEAIPAGAGKIFELGSGWGGLARLIAKSLPGADVCGFEMSWIPWLVSRIFKKGNLNFYKKNFLKEPLEEADVIVCYLCLKGMRGLKTKFENLRPGTWIVSNTFAIPGWEPERVVQLNDIWKSQIYIYLR